MNYESVFSREFEIIYYIYICISKSINRENEPSSLWQIVELDRRLFREMVDVVTNNANKVVE